MNLLANMISTVSGRILEGSDGCSDNNFAVIWIDRFFFARFKLDCCRFALSGKWWGAFGAVIWIFIEKALGFDWVEALS